MAEKPHWWNLLEISPLELARNLSFKVSGKAVHREVSPQKQLTAKLPLGVPGKAARCCWQLCTAGAYPAAEPEPGSKTVSSCSVFPAPSTEKLNIVPVNAEKLLERLRAIFTEHGKRVDLELRGNMLITSTVTKKYK